MPAPTIDTSDVIDFMTDGFWAGGASLNLTYSTVGGSWTGYSAGEEPTDPGFALFNATQANAFIAAMELWDSFVGAEFTLSGSPGAIRAAFTGIDSDGTWGYAYLPANSQSAATRNFTGDIWVDEDMVGTDFAVGSYDFSALLHEIGHALGLDHSFRETGEPASEGLPVEYDNARYSIMSYTDIADYWHVTFTTDASFAYSNYEGVNPVTPMLFDILVAQAAYGVSTTTRSGATTYTFDANFAGLQTIFDSGGVDTLDLSGHTRRSLIDLRPASFSSIDLYTNAQQIEYWVGQIGEGYRSFITSTINSPDTFGWTNNVAIAYDTIIENVICGNSNDNVTGNNANNVLKGIRGNDVLLGAKGADTIEGGAGADKISGGDGIDTLTGNAGNDNFVMNAAAIAANRDVITDFTSGADKFSLENGVYTGLGTATGALAVQQFWSNTTGNAHDADDRIIYNSANGELFYDADGNGGGAKVQIATLTGAPTLAASDFLVI